MIGEYVNAHGRTVNASEARRALAGKTLVRLPGIRAISDKEATLAWIDTVEGSLALVRALVAMR